MGAGGVTGFLAVGEPKKGTGVVDETTPSTTQVRGESSGFPTTYRSRPTSIEAMQWNGQNHEAIAVWMGWDYVRSPLFDRAHDPVSGGDVGRLWVAKSRAWCSLLRGDYVIAEPDGSGFYPCQQRIFEERWEPADAVE